MPRNPHHKPGWAAALASAEIALAQAQQTERAEAARGFASVAHRAALVRLDAATRARRMAFLAQFQTVADYAAWRFAALKPAKDEVAIAWDETDFRSIMDVDETYERALQHRRDGALEERFRLNIGQPAGLAAFADAARMVSSWRRFGAIDCMVSFYAAEDMFHICLAHHWGGLSRESNELFRRVATQLARESIGLMLPEAWNIFERDQHRLAKHRETIRKVNALAAKFHFYRHLLPGHGLHEEFCGIEMTWDGARFVDPEWSAIMYATLPEALREASGIPPAPALPAPE